MQNLLESPDPKPKALLPAPSNRTESNHQNRRGITESSVVTDRWEDTLAPRAFKHVEKTFTKSQETGKETLESHVAFALFQDKAGRVISYRTDGFTLGRERPHFMSSTVTADEEGRTVIVVNYHNITRTGTVFDLATPQQHQKPIKQYISPECSFEYEEKPSERQIITLNKHNLPERVVTTQIIEDPNSNFVTEVPVYGRRHLYDDTGRYLKADIEYLFNDYESDQPGTARETQRYVYFPGNEGSTITAHYRYNQLTGNMVLSNISDNYHNAFMLKGKKALHVPTETVSPEILSCLFQRVTYESGPGARVSNQLSFVALREETIPLFDDQPLYYGIGADSFTKNREIAHYSPELRRLLIDYPETLVDIAKMSIEAQHANEYLDRLDLSLTERIKAFVVGIRSSF